MDRILLKNEFLRLKEQDFLFLEGKTIFATGGTGLIGSFLIGSILSRPNFSISIIITVTNLKKAEEKLGEFARDPRLKIIVHDVRKPLPFVKADFFLHMASTTDPIQYSVHPVETIEINVLGLKNVFELARQNPGSKVICFSSCEVYGRIDSENITEQELGYIDLNNPRSCYNESKRLCENLSACYLQEFGVHYSIVRLSRVYGPTMREDDEKALAQFLKKGVLKQDIVLKSTGEQRFDYLYVSDAVKGILLVMEKGGNEAYNVACSPEMNLRELAQFIADTSGVNVVFEAPSALERRGYSLAKNSLMSTKKITELGFSPEVGLREGVSSVLRICRRDLE